jgi:hypothetical protein
LKKSTFVEVSAFLIKKSFLGLLINKNREIENLKKICDPVADPVMGHDPKKMTRSFKFWVMTQKI